AGHDAFGFVLVQTLDVGLGQDLIQVLVARAASWIADAAFLLAEDRKLHVGAFQNPGQGGRDSLVARVEGRHAADPVNELQLARQVVQSHGSSSETTSPISSASLGTCARFGSPAATSSWPRTPASSRRGPAGPASSPAWRSMYAPTSTISWRGFSGLPVLKV